MVHVKAKIYKLLQRIEKENFPFFVCQFEI